MNILAILPFRFTTALTGDATQAYQTINELKKQSQSVKIIYIDKDLIRNNLGNIINDEEVKDCVKQIDVVHVFTISCGKGLKRILPLIKDIPVGLSTVFWQDTARLIVAWLTRKNHIEFINSAIHFLWNILNHKDFSWCNIILPNSWSEGKCFVKYNRLAENCVIMPIPNAINPPFTRAQLKQLPRSALVPFAEYIVCPGVFAQRKNQLSLIRAAQKMNYPIVFMGNSITGCGWYKNSCMELASKQMLFLEHQDSNLEEYWKILRHARVAILPSDCETPGIAMLEAAYAGARPVITSHGGTMEYFGMLAEYLEPYSYRSIRDALDRAWHRNRLLDREQALISHYTWKNTAKLTLAAYQISLNSHKS